MTDDDADRVPVTLVGGYLGSGKTTLINRLLSGSAVGQMRLAVLVNDVGLVNIDASLIARHSGSTIELTNGCVCCGIGDDFAAALDTVRAMRPPVDHVIVELSGVAEPERIAPWAHTPGFTLDAIIVLADAARIVELLADRYIGDAISAQLAAADQVLLTKTDLVDEARRQRALDAIADCVPSGTTIAVTDQIGLVDLSIHEATTDRTVALGRNESVRLPNERVVSSTISMREQHVVWSVDVPFVSLSALREMIDGLDSVRPLERTDRPLVRAKGLFVVTDREHPVEVQRVGGHTDVRARPDLASEDASNVLTVIARVADHERRERAEI